MTRNMASARRFVATIAGALTILTASAGAASASPAPPPPPNCTAADLTGVLTGVSAATSVYLFTHPPVNDFFTSLNGLDEDERRAAMERFLTDNPQVRDELRAIRQPAKDFRTRCGG
ncbi:heme-binding protein [Mycolicibacterium sp. 22603]|uniref:heme-binding protein n=1 Tax=Mycolicibacterium sp. 22603 TaxID=3453950 RepID=UPI003F83441B